jgi:RsiW-degrading membrane proteinase PrsW (M82 family)
MLLAAFLWGAGVATLGAVVINSIVGLTYGAATASVVSAPMVEEGLKGVFVVGVMWWHSREFDGVVDGLVYAGLTGAGFAFVENILYLANAFTTGVSEGLLTFVARGVITPFAHPLFTAFVGIGVGLAARRTGVIVKIALLVTGYLFAVGLHALWNASAFWDGGRGFLPTYLTVMVPIFLGMLGLALWQRRREQRIVAAFVPTFAQAGWVARSEVLLLSSMSGRRRWRRVVRSHSGPAAARAVRDYQNAVTELAFLADRIRRGTAGSDTAATQRHAEVLDAVVSARQRAVSAAA